MSQTPQSLSSLTPTSTSGYFDYLVNSEFPHELSLSSDPAIDQVLTNVPLFSVGVMAFGVLTFLLSMRRMNRPTAYMILSAAIAFTGAIIDLGALLTSNPSNVFALLVTREMSFAVAVSIRFLFFWIYCAELPNGETPTMPRPRSRDSLILDEASHSASWTRWGTVGLIGKYGLLLQTLVIAILQVIWRFGAIFQIPTFYAIYQASAYVQLAAAVLFGCKFKANIFLSPLFPKSRALWFYLPVFITLFIEIGVSIGQALVWRFSESALGHLMQASEVYILLIMLLSTTFSRHPTPRVSVRGALPDQPQVSTPSFRGVFPYSPTIQSARAIPTRADASGTASRPPMVRPVSTTDRLTNWITRRLSQWDNNDSLGDQAALWKGKNGRRGDIEQNRSPAAASSVFEKSQRWSNDGSGTHETPTAVSREETVRLHDTYRIPAVPPPAIPNQQQRTTLEAPNTRSSNAQGERQSSLGRPTSSTSTTFRVVREYIYQSGLPSPNRNTGFSNLERFQRNESPVYGLNGIVQRLAAQAPSDEGKGKVPRKSSVKSVKAPSRSDPSYTRTEIPASPGMSVLLRQHEELDKAVARLKALSTTYQDSTVTSSSQSVPRLETPEQSDYVDMGSDRRPSVAGQDSMSASYTSDFSLSRFPTPPIVMPALSTKESSSNSHGGDAVLPTQSSSSLVQSVGREDAKQGLSSGNVADPRPSSDNGLDDDMSLAPPPKMPAVAAEQSHNRQLSFPSSTPRTSDASGSLAPHGHVPGLHDGRRWDVTSFIGDLITPQPTNMSLGAVAEVAARLGPTSWSPRDALIEQGSIISQESSSDREDLTQAKIVKNVRRVSSLQQRSPLSTLANKYATFSPISEGPTSDSTPPAGATLEYPRPALSLNRPGPSGSTLPTSPRPPIATGRVVAAAIPRSQGGALQISAPVSSRTNRDGREKSNGFLERPRPAPLVFAQSGNGTRYSESSFALCRCCCLPIMSFFVPFP